MEEPQGNFSPLLAPCCPGEAPPVSRAAQLRCRAASLKEQQGKQPLFPDTLLSSPGCLCSPAGAIGHSWEEQGCNRSEHLSSFFAQNSNHQIIDQVLLKTFCSTPFEMESLLLAFNIVIRKKKGRGTVQGEASTLLGARALIRSQGPLFSRPAVTSLKHTPSVTLGLIYFPHTFLSLLPRRTASKGEPYNGLKEGCSTGGPWAACNPQGFAWLLPSCNSYRSDCNRRQSLQVPPVVGQCSVVWLGELSMSLSTRYSNRQGVKWGPHGVVVE